MSDKRIVKNQLPDVLKSDVAGRTYPVELIRDVYRYSDYSIRRLARVYGLNKDVIEQYVKLGEWDRLREEHKQKMYNILSKDRVELMEMKQDLVQRIEFYTILAAENMLEDLEEHIRTHGDMFVRKEGNPSEILRDGYGNPVLRKIGLSSNDLLKLKGLENIREVNKELLDKAKKEDENLIELEGKTIDVSDFFDKKDQ